MGETEQMAEMYGNQPRHVTFPGDALQSSKPRRQSLEFETFRFTYDFQSNHLYVEEIAQIAPKTAPRQIRFSQEEIAELAAALRSFGLDKPPSGGLECR